MSWISVLIAFDKFQSVNMPFTSQQKTSNTFRSIWVTTLLLITKYLKHLHLCISDLRRRPSAVASHPLRNSCWHRDSHLKEWILSLYLFLNLFNFAYVIYVNNMCAYLLVFYLINPFLILVSVSAYICVVCLSSLTPFISPPARAVNSITAVTFAPDSFLTGHVPVKCICE